MSERSRDLVFISCHQNDRTWLERLGVHLNPLLRRGSLTFWSATEVQAGGDIGAEVCQALSHACVIVLLISADYLASIEIGNMKKLAEAHGVALLWLPVRSSAYSVTELAKIAPLCDPARPLALLRRRDSELELVRICERIVNAVKTTQECHTDSRSRFAWANLANLAKKAFFACFHNRQIINGLLIFAIVIGLSITILSTNKSVFSSLLPFKPHNNSGPLSRIPTHGPNQYYEHIETIIPSRTDGIPVLLPEEWAMAAISIGEKNIKIITEIEKSDKNETVSRRATLIDKRTNKTIAFMIYTAAHVKSWQNSSSKSARILRMVDLSINENEKQEANTSNRKSNSLIAENKIILSPKADSIFHDMGTSSVAQDRDASSVVVHDMGFISPIHDIGTNSLAADLSTHIASLPNEDPLPKKMSPKIVPESFMQAYIINMEQPHLSEKTKYKLICQDVVGSYKVCLDEVGKISNVQVLSGIAEADTEIIHDIKKWLFKPQNRSICFVKQLPYSIQDEFGCNKKYTNSEIIKKDGIKNDDPHLTDQAKELLRGKTLISAYRICIGVDGKVSEVAPMKSIDKAININGADKNMMDTLKTWRYKPQSTEICWIQFLEFHIG